MAELTDARRYDAALRLIAPIATVAVAGDRSELDDGERERRPSEIPSPHDFTSVGRWVVHRAFRCADHRSNVRRAEVERRRTSDARPASSRRLPAGSPMR
jgi:hypothetical protein